MRLLRPLLGLTDFDRQRNPEFRNELKANGLLEDTNYIKIAGKTTWK
jgi:hypothetical protein